MKKIFYFLSALILTIQPTFADAITSNIKQALKQSSGTSYLSVLLSLIFVVLLIYLTGIIYTKLNVIGHKAAKKQYKDMADYGIIIHSTTAIGQNKTLHVIEVKGKKLLIGVSNDSISLIKDLDESTQTQEAQNVNPITKELSKAMPLDKIYPQNENVYSEENIEIKSNVPNEEQINDNPEYNTEEFGLYKKYL